RPTRSPGRQRRVRRPSQGVRARIPAIIRIIRPGVMWAARHGRYSQPRKRPRPRANRPAKWNQTVKWNRRPPKNPLPIGHRRRPKNRRRNGKQHPKRRRNRNARLRSSRAAPEMRHRSRTASTAGVAGASWSALGTSVELRVSDFVALVCGGARVECELDLIDRVCSRFRPDSELSFLNARAGRVVRVSPLLIEAIELARDAARMTDGDVDPTVGRALELVGYDRDWRALAAPRGEAPLHAVTVRARAGWRTVALDRVASTIHIPAGVRIDLGATAKAWAADRAAAAAFAATGCGVLVSLGGDIATSGPAPRDDWPIRVTDDHRSDSS